MRKLSSKTIFFCFLIIVSSALGVTTGSVIYLYKTISGGILGIAVLVLLCLYFVPQNNLKEPSNGMQIDLPRDFKYVPISFFVTLIGVCAIEYTLEFFSSLYNYFLLRN